MTDDVLPQLTADETRRYSRHLTLPQVEAHGQRQLKGARILLVGAGGLGSPAALYLAAAGVGTLGLVDFDVVDVSNLQRQVLHGTRDIGRPKLESAVDRLRDVNPHVHVEPYGTRLSSENAFEIMRGYDVVLDGTDNFATRYLTNDACVLLGIPNVYGSIFRFEGQSSVFATTDGPCYRCLIPEPPPPGSVPSCAEGGVLGILPGLIGTIQATEAIKLVLGIGETLVGRLLLVDALSMEFRTVRVRRDPRCPACGTRTIRELVDYDQFCGDAPLPPSDSIDTSELAALLGRHADVQLLDVREQSEWRTERMAGATWIPLGQLEESSGSLDPTRPIVVYCRSGARSARAAHSLRVSGFANVRSLSGGLIAWKESQPVEQDEQH